MVKCSIKSALVIRLYVFFVLVASQKVLCSMMLVHNKVWCFTSFSNCLTYCKVFFSPCFK